MSAAQFLQRIINVSVSLGTGTNGEDGTQTTTFYGARVLAQIEKSGAPGASFASIRIFGLNLDHINQISSLGQYSYRTRNNTVTLNVGDAVNGIATAFFGVIFDAYADFNAMPEVSFNIEAQSALIDQLKPVSPSSFSGSVDVAVMLSGLATQQNYAFENNGVSVIIPNAYYWGTARDQAYAMAQAANIYLVFDDVNKVLAIWPRDGHRGGAVPLISPDTGLVGYPSFVSNGLGFRVLYNPSLVFGALVQIQSSIPAACGYWIINRLSHRLESQEPGGAWFSDVEGYRNGNTNPNVPT